MTDNEIIKALECCISDDDGTRERPCKGCPLLQDDSCSNSLRKYALDLINRQKAEIERLEKKANTPFAKITFDRDKLQEIVDEYVKNIEIDINLAKSEAIKEFAERLKEKATSAFYEEHKYVDTEDIDNLVKEMTEVETNQRKEDEGK